MQIVKILLPAAAMAAALFAQTSERPLTDSQIESMLAAGLPESTISMTIQAAAMRGMVDLDASPQALAELKQKGASERVLNEVVMAAPMNARLKQTQEENRQREEENRAAPGLPSPSGVYFRTSSGWLALRSFLLWPPYYSGSFFGGKARVFSVPLDGSRAELQVAGGEPAFFVREPASGAPWHIVRVRTEDNQRLLPMIWTGGFYANDRFPQADVREVRMTRAAGDIYTLTPAVPLPAGEYVLCSAVPGGHELRVCYGFGVR